MTPGGRLPQYTRLVGQREQATDRSAGDEAGGQYMDEGAQGDAESRARMEAIASQLGTGDKATAEKSAARFRPAPLDGAANTPPLATSLVGG